MTSETFARWLARERDEGRQLIVFAIGPADGWSEDSRKTRRAAPLARPHDHGATNSPASFSPSKSTAPSRFWRVTRIIDLAHKK